MENHIGPLALTRLLRQDHSFFDRLIEIFPMLQIESRFEKRKVIWISSLDISGCQVEQIVSLVAS